jgi:hypothetical protein
MKSHAVLAAYGPQMSFYCYYNIARLSRTGSLLAILHLFSKTDHLMGYKISFPKATSCSSLGYIKPDIVFMLRFEWAGHGLMYQYPDKPG